MSKRVNQFVVFVDLDAAKLEGGRGFYGPVRKGLKELGFEFTLFHYDIRLMLSGR